MEVVIALLGQNADLGARTLTGLTALHAAASSGNLNLVKLLVAHGMDIHTLSSVSEVSCV